MVQNETNRLTIKFLTNITLFNVSNQFIVGQNTKFVTLDGNNKTFILSNITEWKGLIDGGNNSSNIIIKNFIIDSIGDTTLNSNAGYLLIRYSHFNNTGTNIVENCVNNCDLKLIIGGSGISGERSFSNGDSNSSNIYIIRNCINNGNNIGQNGSGICGILNFSNRNGINTVENCINNGSLNGSFSSGIIGYLSFIGDNNVINCINTGYQGFRTGGITINVSSLTNIFNCYSIGNISSNQTGGILLRITNNTEICNITNCYTLYGNIVYNTDSPTLVNITNCYEPLGNWLTSNAKTNLIINTNVWAYNKINNLTNTNSPFVLLSLNPTNYPVFMNIPCFNKNTKILTNKGYVLIQYLKKGDLVKTLLNDYIPINMIGYRQMYNSYNNDNKDRLYICSNSKYSDITENLIITGSHSILVDNFKEDEKNKTNEILGKIYVTNNKYRLPVCVDNRAKVYEKEYVFTIYHIALDNDSDYKNYGIYANGLLVETYAKKYLKELSQMTLTE
jgi:hypothetical protein